MFIGAAHAEDTYVYNLIGQGAAEGICDGTQFGPAPCRSSKGWNLVVDANGEVTYNWQTNGQITVKGRLCDNLGNCKGVDDVYRVVKTYPGTLQKSMVIDESGKMFEAVLFFNENNGRLSFGGEDIGYLVKAIGDAPDWVYAQPK